MSSTTTRQEPYDELIDDLAYSYDGVFPRQSVAAAVYAARGLERTATVRTSLPVLVARQAREQLMAAAQAEGRIAKTRAGAAVRVRTQRRSLPDGRRAGRAPLRPSCSRPLRRVRAGRGGLLPDLPGRRYEDWDVADPAGQPIEVVRDIRDDIQARATTLLRNVLV